MGQVFGGLTTSTTPELGEPGGRQDTHQLLCNDGAFSGSTRYYSVGTVFRIGGCDEPTFPGYATSCTDTVELWYVLYSQEVSPR